MAADPDIPTGSSLTVSDGDSDYEPDANPYGNPLARRHRVPPSKHSHRSNRTKEAHSEEHRRLTLSLKPPDGRRRLNVLERRRQDSDNKKSGHRRCHKTDHRGLDRHGRERSVEPHEHAKVHRHAAIPHSHLTTAATGGGDHAFAPFRIVPRDNALP